MAEAVTRTLAAQFIEDLGRDYTTQLIGRTGQKLDTTAFQPMVEW